jgi:hypothetical protein
MLFKTKKGGESTGKQEEGKKKVLGREREREREKMAGGVV